VLELFVFGVVVLGLFVTRKWIAAGLRAYKNDVLVPMWKAVLNAQTSKNPLKIWWAAGRELALSQMDNRGAIGVVAMVITVIVAAIAILIGIIVYANVSTAMPTSNLNNETQQMIQNLDSNVNSSFTLLSIGIIILGASFILTVLIVSLGRAAQ